MIPHTVNIYMYKAGKPPINVSELDILIIGKFNKKNNMNPKRITFLNTLYTGCCCFILEN